MYQLAHFSDPHLGPLPQPTTLQLLSKRLVGYINWSRNRAKTFDPVFLEGLISDLANRKPDHIALTGDLVNIALPSEFEKSAEWLKKLEQIAETSVVPGNHDAYVRGALRRAYKHWSEQIRGDGDHRPGDFPYLRHRGPLAIIGCSSALPTPPFMATGDFLSGQGFGMAKLLQENADRCRVVLIHHSPIASSTPLHKRLVSSHRFRNIIARTGAELVLHGHTHLNSLAWIDGKHGKVPVVGVASASNGFNDHRPPSTYNWFKIDGVARNWQIQLERFSAIDERGNFASIDEPVQLSASTS